LSFFRESGTFPPERLQDSNGTKGGIGGFILWHASLVKEFFSCIYLRVRRVEPERVSHALERAPPPLFPRLFQR
jgi:hypothetical protein